MLRQGTRDRLHYTLKKWVLMHINEPWHQQKDVPLSIQELCLWTIAIAALSSHFQIFAFATHGINLQNEIKAGHRIWIFNIQLGLRRRSSQIKMKLRLKRLPRRNFVQILTPAESLMHGSCFQARLACANSGIMFCSNNRVKRHQLCHLRAFKWIWLE